MGYRFEKRVVSEEREVAVVDCTNCGRNEVAPYQERGGGFLPDGWLQIASGMESEGEFCSRECVRQWASGSTETTKIARASFAKASGG